MGRDPYRTLHAGTEGPIGIIGIRHDEVNAFVGRGRPDEQTWPNMGREVKRAP